MQTQKKSGKAEAKGKNSPNTPTDVKDDDSKKAMESDVEVAENIEDSSEEQSDSSSADKQSTDAEKLASVQEEVKEWQDKYMRLHAEWDTYRRRTSAQRAEEQARAGEKLVEKLLPVIDDFERTLDYAKKNGEANLEDGVKAVHSKFIDVLKSGGVEVICPEGEAFNALECQAVATVEDTSVYDETVCEVYQKGYKMGTKVIRPAMVTVTSGGKKRPDEQEDGKSDKE